MGWAALNGLARSAPVPLDRAFLARTPIQRPGHGRRISRQPNPAADPRQRGDNDLDRLRVGLQGGTQSLIPPLTRWILRQDVVDSRITRRILVMYLYEQCGNELREVGIVLHSDIKCAARALPRQ